MRARVAADPLALWRGVDDAARRESAAAPCPADLPSHAPETVSDTLVLTLSPTAPRPARLLQPA